MNRTGVIRTLLKDQSLQDEDERGVRSWRSAELVAEDWFLVERCVQSPEGLDIRRWISTSIEDCRRLLHAENCQWSRLLAYVRVPRSAGPGYVFGEVVEVHEVGSSGGRLLRFSNGMTILQDGPASATDSGALKAEELQRIFSGLP